MSPTGASQNIFAPARIQTANHDCEVNKIDANNLFQLGSQLNFALFLNGWMEAGNNKWKMLMDGVMKLNAKSAP